MKSKYVIAFLILVVLVIIDSFMPTHFWDRFADLKQAPEQTENVEQITSPTSENPFKSLDHNSLTIEDQRFSNIRQAGLIINDTYFEKPGFVVISDIKDDAPNNVIPSDLGIFTSNEVFDSVIAKLDISTGTYFAQLYEDDGDESFDKEKDKVLPLYSTDCNCYNDKFVIQFSIE